MSINKQAKKVRATLCYEQKNSGVARLSRLSIVNSRRHSEATRCLSGL